MPNRHARRLRNNLTEAEKFLWQHLRQRQINECKFRRQQPIGFYIVDFVCFEKKLIIELDGGQHNEREIEDYKRDTWLETNGFRILRFWNNQVFKETDAVLDVIAKACGTPTPSLPHQGGGGVCRGLT